MSAIMAVQVSALLLLCFSLDAWAGAQQIPPAGSAQPISVSNEEQSSGRGTDNATLRLAPSIQLSYKDERHEFHFRGNRTDLVREVLGAYGITAIVSEPESGRIIRFDTEPVAYPVAADMIRLATASLIVPLDSTHVLVAGDTKENREALLRMPTEVLYLPALSAAEIQDVANIAKNIFDVKQVSIQPASNTVMVRATETTLLALNEIVVDLLGGQSEVALDMRLIETDKSRTVEAGVQLPQSSTVFNVDRELDSAIQQNASAVDEIVSSGLASADDSIAIVAILVEEGLVTGVLSDPFALFGGGITETGITFGNLTANLLLDSSDTRQLQQALIKVAENEPATLKVGSRYPIETSSYTGAYYTSSGTVSSSTTPQISYQDIGLNLKVTPRPESGGRIHLAMEMKVQALEGESINGLPVLTSRSLVSQTSVREGASTTLTSVLSKSASGSLDQLPGLDGATTAKTGEDSITRLAAVITPYLVRSKHMQTSSRVVLLPLHD